MPTYQVEDAQGRVLELEGDHDPTEAEMQTAFSEAFAAPSKTLADFAAELDAAVSASSPVTAGELPSVGGTQLPNAPSYAEASASSGRGGR